MCFFTRVSVLAVALPLMAPVCMMSGQSRDTVLPVANQSLYLELGGSAGLVSANYDRKLNSSFTARVGYAKWAILRSIPAGDQESDYGRLVPVTLNLLRPVSTDPSWLEAGVGYVWGERWQGVATNPHVRFSAATAHIAYRARTRHTMLRVSLSAFLNPSTAFPHRRPRPGVAWGIVF